MAHVRVATQQSTSAEAAARVMSGDDVPTHIVLRAATMPASITDAAWAGALAAQAVDDAIAASAVLSAGAALTLRAELK